MSHLTTINNTFVHAWLILLWGVVLQDCRLLWSVSSYEVKYILSLFGANDGTHLESVSRSGTGLC